MLTLNGGATTVSGTAESACSSTSTPGFCPTVIVASTVGGAMRHRRPRLASFDPG